MDSTAKMYSWTVPWVWRVLYWTLSVFIAWVVWKGIRQVMRLFRIFKDLFSLWHTVTFGSANTSVWKSLRLQVYFCETHHLDKTALKELKSLIDEAIDNKSTVDDLRRAVLTYSHIMLCRERTDGSLRGMALLKIEHKGTYTLLKSGLMAFQHQYRGGPYIYLAAAFLALKEMVLHPWTPVYVIGKLYNYRSYLMATRFSVCYPVYNKETPEFFRKLLLEHAEAIRSPNETFHRKRLVLEREVSTVKVHAAVLTDEDLKNPHVKFFTEQNPEWRKGHCMMCTFQLSGWDLLRSGMRRKRQKEKGASSSLAKEMDARGRKISKPRPSIYKRMTFYEPLANKYAVEMYEVDCFGSEADLARFSLDTGSQVQTPSTVDSPSELLEFDVPMDLKM